MISKTICLLISVMFVLNVPAQQVMINEKPGERPLAWSDFTGTPVDNDQYLAFTNWKIEYVYSGIGLEDDSVYIDGLKVTLKFVGEKSWVKEGKGTDDLLKHEQGHFDIGRLCQLEMLAYVKTTTFDKYEFKTQLKEIFKNSFEKYRALGKKYDEETNHGINKEKQEEWINFLETENTHLLNAGR